MRSSQFQINAIYDCLQFFIAHQTDCVKEIKQVIDNMKRAHIFYIKYTPLIFSLQMLCKYFLDQFEKTNIIPNFVWVILLEVASNKI